MTDETTPLPHDIDDDALEAGPAETRSFHPPADDTMPLPLEELAAYPPESRHDEPAAAPEEAAPEEAAPEEAPTTEALFEEPAEPAAEEPAAETPPEQPEDSRPEEHPAEPPAESPLEEHAHDAPLAEEAEPSLEEPEGPVDEEAVPTSEEPAAEAPAEPSSPYENLPEPASPFFGDDLDEEPSAPLLDERSMHPLPPLPEEMQNPLPPLPADVPEEPAARSSLAAVGRVLVLPRSTFARVAEEYGRAWVAGLAIIALAAITKGGVALGFTLRGAVPAAELPSVLVRYGGALLGPIAFVFAAAGLLLAAQRWWQGDARFQTILTVTTLSLVPLAVRDFGQAVYMVIGHSVLLNPGLSALVAPAGHSVLHRSVYALLGQIDAFTIWALVLLAMATAVTHGRGRLRRVMTALLIGVVLALVWAVPSFFIAPFITR
jgi:hypothetical protein